MTQNKAGVRSVYDAAAEPYQRALPGLDAEQAEDRRLLASFAERVAATGRRRVLDAGCGTGRVLPLLGAGGLEPWGVDLSEGMVAVARRAGTGVGLCVADLDRLPFVDREFGGVLAWYSLIHHRPEGLTTAIGELARVLVPGGWFLTAFQAGSGGRHIDDAYGTGLGMDAHLHTSEHVAAVVDATDLTTVTSTVRRAEGRERHDQGFVLARKRAEDA